MRLKLLVILLAGLSLATTTAEGEIFRRDGALTVATYNVCNLFDTINDPGIRDNLPTPEHYRHKIEALARVIGELGPDMIGLCEVENAAVLRDLTTTAPLDSVPYRLLHYESPDRRGIDVALLYRADRIETIASEPIRFSTDYPTRDVLRVELRILGSERRMVVYVLHLPSRRGGYSQATRMRETIAATIGEQAAREEPGVGVIVLGDLNDTPASGLVRRMLATEATGLRCLTAAAHRKGIGSYAWRDSWLMYDHILVNREVNAIGDARVFRRPWMLTATGRFRGYPDRAISDHLPVYIRILY
ncbi:MAG: endonuclease/exonuclease/phosphatase family protein [Rikenella sp.]|nr:endonuclease/exonuclease/phosphatase family protein [Rikenella sp.]